MHDVQLTNVPVLDVNLSNEPELIFTSRRKVEKVLDIQTIGGKIIFFCTMGKLLNKMVGNLWNILTAEL